MAQVAGLRFRGFPAWFLHRTYHVMRIPTFNRKARVIADWTLALFFRRDVVQLGSLQHPREAFAQAIGGSGATEPGGQLIRGRSGFPTTDPAGSPEPAPARWSADVPVDEGR